MADIREMQGNVGSQLERSLSVRGTFTATAVWGLGTGSAMDRTGRATEQTAQHTRRLLDEARQGGLTFG
ncbi:MAG: hypothetical protein ACOC7S_02475 [Planctomycetota bacterium]